MNTPHDIYDLNAPSPDPGQSQYQGNRQAYGGPPNMSAPVYYSQAPSWGCGTMIFRIAMGLIVFIVLGFLFLAFMSALGTVLIASMDQSDKTLEEKWVLGAPEATKKIAIVSIGGMIMESEDGFIPRQIRQVLKDDEVVGVVLRIDSPGGTMTGSDYYHYLLKKMKEERNIPIVVSMGSMATSGGYYVAMVADEIFAEPTTVTGSIGVIVPMYKGVEMCKKIGIESTPITSGPLKSMGSFDKPLSEEQRAVWQRLVDDNFARFKQIIRDGRDEFARNPEELDRLATGQIYTATEAVENKLIDKIGYLDDAVEAVMDRLGLTEDDSKTIRYKTKKKFADFLLESRSSIDLLQVESLVEMTVPRVFLLAPDVLPLPTSERRK